MTVCWFCEQEITEGEPADRHHCIAKRYLKRQKLAQRHVIVPSHATCHVKWHRKYDSPSWSWPVYTVAMNILNWGQGIFSL